MRAQYSVLLVLGQLAYVGCKNGYDPHIPPVNCQEDSSCDSAAACSDSADTSCDTDPPDSELEVVDTGSAATCLMPRFSGHIADDDPGRWLFGQPGECFGSAVISAGDQDLDGFEDLLVGAYCAEGGRGAAYLVLSDGERGVHRGSRRIRLTGPAQASEDSRDASPQFGYEMAVAYDLYLGQEGGPPALLIGAPGLNVDGVEDAGAVFVLPGGVRGDRDLTELTGGELVLTGRALNGQLGATLAVGELLGSAHPDVYVGGAGGSATLLRGPIRRDGAGRFDFEEVFTDPTESYLANDAVFADITGDGVDELITTDVLADHGELANSGAVYVRRARDLSASRSAWPVWQTVRGDVHEGYLGFSIDAGDIDQDGVLDLLVGAPGRVGQIDSNPGAAWVVDGASLRAGAATEAMFVSDVAVGFDGARAQQRAGRDVEIIPDLDGDGFSELLVSTDDRDPGSPEYLVYLRSGADEPNASVLGQGDDAWFDGPSSFGKGVAEVGDITGDGCPDIVITAKSLDLTEERLDAGGLRIVSWTDAAGRADDGE